MMSAADHERRAGECRTRAALLAILSTVLLAAVFAFAIHQAPALAIGAAMAFVWGLFAAATQMKDAARHEDEHVVLEHLRRQRERRESI
ncbi:hypothetical protein OKA04_12725 [Luteolibacter flavescens]|uniref:Uncharacterized protein n=1 Tax=Luteolibacter flavescens TaxID=1859460 RepID=A0ABT3FRJ9_9BACT|nr:hypothetical protein [Luteolibacter flavescens]MCW1885595.1 hypothetical protein [Luteolibacter flavescens]